MKWRLGRLKIRTRIHQKYMLSYPMNMHFSKKNATLLHIMCSNDTKKCLPKQLPTSSITAKYRSRRKLCKHSLKRFHKFVYWFVLWLLQIISHFVVSPYPNNVRTLIPAAYIMLSNLIWLIVYVLNDTMYRII